MRKTKRNSGFSIMETVIALAMIAIVTIAALSVVLSAISARVKQANYSEAQDFAHNILECFKAAEDETEFVNNTAFADIVLYASADPEYTYSYVVANKISADIKAEFGTDKDEFEITVADSKGEEIISFSYTKGAKE